MKANVELLLKRADSDLDSAVEIIQKGVVEKYYQAGFFIQQCVEKSIKAVLKTRDMEFAFTHSISKLIGQLEKGGVEIPECVLQASEVTLFDMGERYDVPFTGTLDDLIESSAAAREVLSWATKLCNKALLGS